ncbi:MAG: thiol:disulfide interchange protein DsbA/DsbL [Psittacicella sp.]
MIKKISSTILVLGAIIGTAYAGTFYGGPASSNKFIPKVGVQYTVLKTPYKANTVTEFMSFYCPHCYNYEMVYDIPEKVRAGLPKGAIFNQYTVNFFKMQSVELSRAWSMAQAYGYTSKVEKPMYTAVINGQIASMKDIKEIFVENGVTASEFDSEINSKRTNAIVQKQLYFNKVYNINETPTFIVDGKYQINPEGFKNVNSYQEFAKEFSETVVYLLKNKTS